MTPERRLAVAAAGILGIAVVLLGSAIAVLAVRSPVATPGASAVADPTERLRAVLEGSPSAVSLATATGPFVVGLTMAPDGAGDATVLVTVLGLNGPSVDAASVGGLPSGNLALEPCGDGCWEGTAPVAEASTLHLIVTLATPDGPVEAEFAVPVGAPDGSAELDRAIAAVDDLRSMRQVQELRATADGDPLLLDYRFEAPDRMRLRTDDFERIVIGERRWSNDGTGWNLSSSVAFTWPEGHDVAWANPAAVRILGEESVGDIPCRIVAFVRPDLPAWYRLWVGVEDGLVHRQEMRAIGHVMDDAFSEFDSASEIGPPGSS